MAGPSKVEFPGQKKNQRMRMRGTKQASADAQKRLRKQLSGLLDEPEKVMPDMMWTGKLAWGRVDPVTKSLKKIRRVIENRTNRSWLVKRMKGSKGDSIAKALAGSLVAALDDEISMVATFKHPIYGNGAFVRKGDAKPAAMVGVQQFHNPRLRLLPWEEHAKAGWYFFSWKGGFVCTGNEAKVPTEWIEDGIKKSVYKSVENDGCHIIGELDGDVVAEGLDTGEGYIRLEFQEGSVVGIQGSLLEERGGKDPFIQPLALKMLPPKISSIVDAELKWRPNGWPEGEPLPESADERVQEVFDAWLNLGVDESQLWMMLKQALLANLDRGFVVGDTWFGEDDIDGCLVAFSGGENERRAVEFIISRLHEEGRGVAIDSEGGAEWLEDVCVIRSRATTLHNFLKASWGEFGLELLEELGVDEEVAHEIWQKQLERPAPFNNFLRKVIDGQEEKNKLARIPWSDISLKGLCGEVQDLVHKAASEGVGKANAMAAKMRGSIEVAALGWAWLTAQGKGSGNEWHFENAARDKGGEWAHSVAELWGAAESILTLSESDDGNSAEEYGVAMERFRKKCGEQNELPSR